MVACGQQVIYNDNGQLGDGTIRYKKQFVRVLSSGATAVAAGAFYSMVLGQDGSVWATGSNKDGQFGVGTTQSETVFIQLPFVNGAQHGTLIHMVR